MYAYPPDPQAVKRTSRPTYGPAYQSSYSFHTVNPQDSDDNSDDEELGQDDETALAAERKRVETYLGFSNDVLANLLCPNRELCDQPFELVVDQFAFVGHPVWLGDEDATRRPSGSGAEDDDVRDGEHRGRTRRRRDMRAAGDPPLARSSSSTLDLAGSGSLVDRDPTVVPSRPIRQPQDRATSAPPTHPQAGRPTSPIPLAISPTSSFASSLAPLSSINSSQHSVHGSGRLASFNFIVVVDTPPDSHLSSHLEGYYKDVIVPVTANLKALERKSKWLGKEAARLHNAHEAYLDNGTSQNHFNTLSI